MPRQKIPDFKCQECPSIYLSQNGLDNHILKEHSNKNEDSPKPQTPNLPKYIPRNRSSTYNCKLCNFKYLEQSGLDKHMVKDHNIISESADEVISPMSVVMNRPAAGQVNSNYTPRRRTQDFKCLYCPPESPSIYLSQNGLDKHVVKEHSSQDEPTPKSPNLSKSVPSRIISSPHHWKKSGLGDEVIVPAAGQADPLAIVIEKIGSNGEDKARKRNLKKKKDPNAPKRALTAYFLFMADERTKVKDANPGFGVADISKELGNRWNNMDEFQKEKYIEMAAKDRARYDAEMKEYKENQA